jgi:pimeloyl-ACP methyl ester carboxylesterase
VLVSLSRGAERSLLLGAGHPERIDGMVFIAPALPMAPAMPRARAAQEFAERREAHSGWEKWNRHYWLEHYEALCGAIAPEGNPGWSAGRS